MYKRSLKHPITALLIAILACGFAMVMNTQMMLGEKVQEIEDGFFTSTPGERSIYSRALRKARRLERAMDHTGKRGRRGCGGAFRLAQRSAYGLREP